MRPEVSVVIPCYTDAETLPRAINSVLAQTYAPIEIVVVNDCSPQTDLIEKHLAGYPNVTYLRNAENRGLAATRNVGILAARGSLIAFLDADDEYLPGKIDAQVKALSPGCVVTCGTLNVQSGARVATCSTARHVKRASRLAFRNTLNGAALLASKDILVSNDLYDPSLRSCEDFDLYLRLLDSGVSVTDLGEALYVYHYNANGLSKDLRSISFWEHIVVRKYADRQGAHYQRSLGHVLLTAVWTLRHLSRAELCDDADFLAEIRLRTASLSLPGYARWCLTHVGGLRLVRPVASLAKRLGIAGRDGAEIGQATAKGAQQ